MIERHIARIACDDAGMETLAGTRERLKACFAPGATRRMSQLGMLLGGVLGKSCIQDSDTIVYASEYGESRSLETFLDGFPTPSPTAFQSSIHPGAVQQLLIGRQQAVGEFTPLTGGSHLPVHAVLLALESPGERVVLCGGEEHGGWLRECEGASDRAFAFALTLTRSSTDAVGRLRLVRDPDPAAATLTLAAWFDLMKGGRSFAARAGCGWSIECAFPE